MKYQRYSASPNPSMCAVPHSPAPSGHGPFQAARVSSSMRVAEEIKEWKQLAGGQGGDKTNDHSHVEKRRRTQFALGYA